MSDPLGLLQKSKKMSRLSLGDKCLLDGKQEVMIIGRVRPISYKYKRGIFGNPKYKVIDSRGCVVDEVKPGRLTRIKT